MALQEEVHVSPAQVGADKPTVVASRVKMSGAMNDRVGVGDGAPIQVRDNGRQETHPANDCRQIVDELSGCRDIFQSALYHRYLVVTLGSRVLRPEPIEPLKPSLLVLGIHFTLAILEVHG